MIDWFTIGAQALNFLILVWLMKRYLYQPILKAIDEREKNIAHKLSEAEKQRSDAQNEHDKFQHKNDEFDQNKAALLAKATDEVKVKRQQLLDEVRKAADELSTQRQETLQREQQSLNDEIARRTQVEVFAISRKALKDLAGTDLEERMSEVFTQRLRELNGESKAALAEAIKTASDPAIVRSAFDLGTEECATIQKAINEIFSAEVQLRFETAPNLISGIELSANGQKMAWSIADYLDSLETGVSELLKKKSKPEEKAEAKPDNNGEAMPEEKAEAKPDNNGEAKPEEKAEAKPDNNGEAKPEEKAEAKSEKNTETPSKTTAGSEQDTKEYPAPDTEETEQETKEYPKPETKSKPKSESEAKPDTKAEPKSDSASESP